MGSLTMLLSLLVVGSCYAAHLEAVDYGNQKEWSGVCGIEKTTAKCLPLTS